MRKKYLRVILGWLVVSLTAYFFTRALMSNWDNISEIDFGINGYSFLALACFIFAVLLSGLLWRKILLEFNIVVGRTEAVKIQVSSWLLKYIPGQAGSYVNKVAWGAKAGHSKKVVTMSFVYENLFLLLASLFLSIPVLVIFSDRVGSNLSLFVPLLLALFAVPLLNKKTFYRLANFLLQKLRGQKIAEEFFFDRKVLMRFFGEFLIPRVITAAGFILVAASFLHITPSMYIGLGAAYTLAGIVGILAIFVPSGIGVREAVIVLFVSSYFPIETAIALSLVARLYSTVADGILGVVYLGLNRVVLK